MDASESVRAWLVDLKLGEPQAAQKIWERYSQELIRLARHRLRHEPQRDADAEDVVQEAFACFFRAIEAGRFPRLDDRDDLWQVLTMLTDRRIQDRRRHIRAQRRVRSQDQSHPTSGSAGCDMGTGAGTLEELVTTRPSPTSVEALIELLRDSFACLKDPLLCRIAIDKLQGYSAPEIAERHDMALRSVQRKLQLVRQLLRAEIPGFDPARSTIVSSPAPFPAD